MLFCVSSIHETCDLNPGAGVDIRVPNANALQTAAIATLSTSDGSYVWGHAWVAPASSQLSDVVVSETTNDLLLPINSVNGTIDMDPGSGTVNVQTVYQRLVILALDQLGAFRWFTQLQPVDDGYCSAAELEVKSTGQIVVAGDFTRSVDFNPGPGIELRTAVGASQWPADEFVLALDSVGRFDWVSVLTGPGDIASISDLVVTPAGAIVLHGKFAGTLDCDPSSGVFELQSQWAEASDPFFLALTAEGALKWAGKVGRFTWPGEMISDAQNRLWVPITWTNGYDDLDPTIGVWTQDTFAQRNSILLTLEAETGAILSHRRVQSSWPGFVGLNALALAPSNQSIRWGGAFSDAPLDIDPGLVERLLTPPSEGSHGLVLRLNPDGSW